MSEDYTLTNRISQWLQDTQEKQGVSVSRSLEEKGFGNSNLPKLVEWIEDNGYSKQEVKQVLEENKEHYPTQKDGAGLKRDAGGEQKFRKKKEILLEKL
jgi:hypothetical protein